MTAPRVRPLSCRSCAQRFRRATPKLRDLLHRAPLDALPVNRRLHWCDDAGVPLCSDSAPARQVPAPGVIDRARRMVSDLADEVVARLGPWL